MSANMMNIAAVDGHVVITAGCAQIHLTPVQALDLRSTLKRVAAYAATMPSPAPAAVVAAAPADSGPACAFCGNATARKGTCFTCQSCGETTGCG